ncbi:hypothetical protein Kfla_3901 [Kribbella flavida DSM 17836]|uniref:GerMN domain-containing protein n=1 Tax=Kribbella flavida (strain DSM 17836 / JCM 10339 / NBRC 14399) TaxID=479435 RepID=D2PQ29_KRIFD|nr:GerMN domain-containing protein [Kribbella flavida]ADB32953.1 hypothetical protein Kfla_3901 [Kribbella flavida DSM 17836]
MRRAAGCLGVLVLVAGCGIPTQDQPSQVAASEIPAPLRGDGTPQPSVPATVDPGDSSLLIYFVRDDRLIGLPRETPTGSRDDRLSEALDSLTAGPSEKEQAAGITTAFPAGLDLAVEAVDGTRVVLNLSGETDGRSATDNVLTVGQVVLSLTSLPSVTEITFVRDGTPVEALLPGGALTADPLTAADYLPLKHN